MTELVEMSQDDYGFPVQITLYKAGDSATAEDLSTATGVTLDIGRLDETPIVEDGAVTITTAASGSAGGYIYWTAKADNAGTTVSIVNQENVTFGGGDGLTTAIATDGSGNTTITTTAAGFAGIAIAGNAGYVPDSTAATAGTFLKEDGTWAAAGGLPTITVNTGSQTGTQTVYPLSVTPSSVNYVNVFINGVYQAKSSYSVSGTNLTFATAPPNNSVIEFVTTT